MTDNVSPVEVYPFRHGGHVLLLDSIAQATSQKDKIKGSTT